MKQLIILLFAIISATAQAQSAADIRAYIAKYTRIALDEERAFGIPAPITLAQGILESGAGRSGLTRNANNHFGIKAFGGWKGAVYQAWDDEPQKSRFRVYGSAAESFRDHSLFLKNNTRYRSLSPRAYTITEDGPLACRTQVMRRQRPTRKHSSGSLIHTSSTLSTAASSSRPVRP